MSGTEINMLLSRNIDALMKAKGTDAAKLARSAGLNQGAIYDILGKRSKSPKIQTVAKIAKALEVPLPMLFSENLDEAIDREIVYLFDSLPSQEQARLIQIARALLPVSET